MQINSISTQKTAQFNPIEISSDELIGKKNIISDKSQTPQIESNWQLDILINALDKLESKKELSNSSHPLDKPGNVPIDNFQQALKELTFFGTETFRNQALEAQGNVTPQSLLAIFVD